MFNSKEDERVFWTEQQLLSENHHRPMDAQDVEFHIAFQKLCKEKLAALDAPEQPPTEKSWTDAYHNDDPVILPFGELGIVIEVKQGEYVRSRVRNCMSTHKATKPDQILPLPTFDPAVLEAGERLAEKVRGFRQFGSAVNGTHANIMFDALAAYDKAMGGK